MASCAWTACTTTPKVFVNGKQQGTLDRRLGQTSLTIHADAAENTLDILVENGGRINFSKHLRDQRKGITGPVTLAGKELRGGRSIRYR